ncbi:hypothetical protein AAMO2058_000421600 [Amorphochlora amoebiformis]
MPIGRRVLEAFGGSKTVDSKFDELSKNLLLLERKVLSFSKIVQKFQKDLKQFHQASVSEAQNMAGYYEDGKNEPMLEYLEKLGGMYKDTLEIKYPLLTKTVDGRISSALTSFQTEIAQVKARMKERNEARLQYDHYLNKLDKLKKEKEKVTSSGSLATWKNKDKFHRNEKKFAKAKDDYEKLNSNVVEEMTILHNNRFVHINKFCSSFVKMQMFYFAAYGKQCGAFIAPLKDVVKKTTASAQAANDIVRVSSTKGSTPPRIVSAPRTPVAGASGRAPAMPTSSPPKVKPAGHKRSECKFGYNINIILSVFDIRA